MEKMTFGKHKGVELSLVPIGYLKWVSESFSPGNIRDMVDRELSRRTGSPVADLIEKMGQERTSPKKRNRAIPDDSRTHYQWTDRTGKVHMIPNDVSMEGTENEECPFVVSETNEGPAEQFGELDREFRAMFC